MRRHDFNAPPDPRALGCNLISQRVKQTLYLQQKLYLQPTVHRPCNMYYHKLAIYVTCLSNDSYITISILIVLSWQHFHRDDKSLESLCTGKCFIYTLKLIYLRIKIKKVKKYFHEQNLKSKLNMFLIFASMALAELNLFSRYHPHRCHAKHHNISRDNHKKSLVHILCHIQSRYQKISDNNQRW